MRGLVNALDRVELIEKTTAEVAAATGHQFFQALVEHLAVLLRADRTVLKRLRPGSRPVTLAVAPQSEALDWGAGALDEMPVAELLEAGNLIHTESESGGYWTGVLLSDSSGHPQGILSVRFRIPPTDLGEIEAALLRFAPRAAVEIERTRPAEIRYQELIEQGSDAVWCLEPLPPIPLNLPEDEIVARCWESRIAVANDAAARLLEGEHPSNVVEHRVGEFRALLPNLETQIRRQIRDGFRPRTEEFCDVRDGVESWWERSVLPIVAGGKFLRAWATTRDISERHRYDEDIQALNTTLQNVVADRTAQLAAANRELESFSHSVSHDLRAAIQGILACSRIVVQDYGNKLDDTAKLWLTHMAEDAAQLDKLTMALLDLTLVSRAHFSRGPVDLSGLAESTCQRLAESDPARQARFRIAPGLVVSGDDALLCTVMDNLLGNAWKFTKPRPVAEIEFGRTEQSGDPVFFVRDNGVGFNMKYAEKLFGAFQRLHRVEDFPGNGIGLATVRRVVHRHGGRVWADAKAGVGATFFFTLGQSEIP